MPSLTQECMRLARPKQDLCLACAAERSSSQRDRNTTMPQKVCIVGSGNWGSAIARIVGVNAREHAEFEEKVDMWVFEEQVDGKNLTEIINTTHVNVKYLPGATLPDNIVAVPDLKAAAAGASILIFVLPHQFLGRIMPQIKEAGVAPDCKAHAPADDATAVAPAPDHAED